MRKLKLMMDALGGVMGLSFLVILVVIWILADVSQVDAWLLGIVR